MTDFEKLGLFYLGRRHAQASGTTLDDLVLYDSRDLVTHALAVGMTGSGKTGLGLILMEEAAIDGVPVLAIDPKGDLGNLLLTFPSLSTEAFRPWVDEDDARRAGLSADAFAARQAEAWTKGLAGWGQDGSRIERLRRSADVTLFTPGSRAGRSVSILSSFAAPPPAARDDGEGLAERAAGTATSALVLAGVDAPPRSREHSLLAAIMTEAWRRGHDLDLPALIRQVQTPPFDRVGVIDLESFYPAKERFDLAMRLNGVLAAPGFEAWVQGEPLDPGSLLYTAEGRPRVSIFSIAHLGDAERMFFVSLLLHQIVGWMRRQPGTTSLRAMLYMDEIFGYFPPVASPPSKLPLLTLLKQARAHGLGVVLATQNPVDLDYKGLSNIGTWFLGRLQTDRDRARVLDGLEGTAAALDRSAAERALSGLAKRVFLLHNVHARAPTLFETRWTLSYLRGPLSRDQIRALQPETAGPAAAPAPPVVAGPHGHWTPDASAAPATGDTGVGASGWSAPAGLATPEALSTARVLGLGREAAGRPVVPPGIREVFLPAPTSASVTYRPAVLGVARVHLSDTKLGVDERRDVSYLVPVADDAADLDWAHASRLESSGPHAAGPPHSAAAFEHVPAAALQPRNYARWEKGLARWLAQHESIALFRDPALRLTSAPGESEREFQVRARMEARAARDAAVDAVRKKYAAKEANLAERLRRAEAAVAREQEQASGQRAQTAISMGATLLGALFGRRATSAGTIGRATTAARGVGRSMKEASDVKRAAENVEAARTAIARLGDEVAADMAAVSARYEQERPIEAVVIRPRRGAVEVQYVALAWVPEPGSR